ncbi:MULTISPECIES: hypothetical protein [Actinomadura]|uniref:hypothetical protein n=1 Tax=Actinomadura TaxID=1988 RepID=UPI0026309C4A|nr:hypothetical protein [Actinomadura geliboluensis]
MRIYDVAADGDRRPAAGRHGTLKLTDFGIASPTDMHSPAQGTEPAPGVIMGTAGYLSPELARKVPPSPAGDTQADMLRRHLHDTPVPPGRLRPHVPVELERAVLRLLVKDPAARRRVLAPRDHRGHG